MAHRSIAAYEDPSVKNLRALVKAARDRLAEIEATYTIEKANVDGLQAALFNRLREYFQERDRLRLIVDYRKQFLDAFLHRQEGDVEKIAQDYRDASQRATASTKRRPASCQQR